MRNLGGDENDFAGLDRLRPLSFDLDREISLQHEDDLLGARMHVPGSAGAGRHFQDIDHGLLDLLILALQIGFQK